MSAASSVWEAISVSLMYLLGLGAVVGLFAAPSLLYRRYRRRYGQSEAFDVAWTEQGGEGPFRSAERQIESRVELSQQAEWSAKIGFFLGILGMLWTPLVVIGAAGGLMPMATVGLPGLVVSWSVFFASRSVLKRGPAGAPLLRFSAVAEIVMNLWVLALVALCTASDARMMSSAGREALGNFLLVGRHDLEMYEIPYSLQKAGVISLGYVLLSMAHGWLSLRAWAPLERARRQQEQAAQPA